MPAAHHVSAHAENAPRRHRQAASERGSCQAAVAAPAAPAHGPSVSVPLLSDGRASILIVGWVWRSQGPQVFEMQMSRLTTLFPGANVEKVIRCFSPSTALLSLFCSLPRCLWFARERALSLACMSLIRTRDVSRRATDGQGQPGAGRDGPGEPAAAPHRHAQAGTVCVSALAKPFECACHTHFAVVAFRAPSFVVCWWL